MFLNWFNNISFDSFTLQIDKVVFIYYVLYILKVNEYTSDDFHYCEGKHDQHVSVLPKTRQSDGTALQTSLTPIKYQTL